MVTRTYHVEAARAAPGDSSGGFGDQLVQIPRERAAAVAEVTARYEDSCRRQGIRPTSQDPEELLRRFSGVTYRMLDVTVRRMHAGGR